MSGDSERRIEQKRAARNRWNRKWDTENPEKRRAITKAHRVKKEFGISVEEYDAIIAKGCAICKKHDNRMCLDHDHETGKIRDALCFKCNLAIAHLCESSVLAGAAGRYLMEHGKDRVFTVKDISSIAQVHESTVRGWIEDGKLRAWKEGQVLRIDRDAFDDFKRARQVAPTVPERKLTAISGGRL